MTSWASSVRPASAVTIPRRSSPVRAVVSARPSPSNLPVEAAGWSAATSTKPRRTATADAIVAAGGDALAVHCDVTSLDDVGRLAKFAQDWFGGTTDRCDQQRRCRRGRQRDRRHRHRRLALGSWHQPVGPHPRLSRVHADSARGRLRRDHQRRVGRRFRRGSRHGRVQRQQGGRAVAVRDPCRRTVRHRCARHGAVPDVRQDQHRRDRPDQRQVDRDCGPADALDRVLARAGSPHLPRTL